MKITTKSGCVSLASKVMTCAFAMAAVAMSSVIADAQTVIIDDSFDDGITANAPDQLGFNTTSSSAGLDLDQAPGPVDFASGNSARTIHALFPAQTLEEFGDVLTVTFDFTTPTTISFDVDSDPDGLPESIEEDFKFGLFDTSTTAGVMDVTTMAPIDFTGPISSASGTLQPGLNMAGIQCEVDNINAPGTDLGIRTHNVNSIEPAASAPTGRLFGTNTGFDFIAGGDDDVTSFLPNSDYTGTISLAYTDETLTSFEITVGMTGEGVNGPYNDVFTRTVLIADTFDPGDFANMIPASGSAGVNTTTFDLIAFNATSGAFGGTDGPTPGSSAVGEDNNGIDISNVTITFTDISEMSPIVKGDVNLDGTVDFFDIQPFIDALSGATNQPEADVDCNGMVEFFDIQPFIDILAGNP